LHAAGNQLGGQQEVVMVTDTRRLGSRIAAPIASLFLVAFIAAACASGATGVTTQAVSLGSVPSPTQATVPAVLPAATSTPGTSLAVAGPALTLQDQFVAVIKQPSSSRIKSCMQCAKKSSRFRRAHLRADIGC